MQKLQAVVAAGDVEVETLNCCSRCKKLAAQKSYLFPDTWQLTADGQREESRPAK
jgi:uncharacterized metal-binding protein YceD (DUF177 family)